MREPKQYVRCPECGSTDVERDALCRWNVETQEWEIASVLDSSTCGHCGYESNVFDWVNKYTTEQVECRAFAAALRQQGEQATVDSLKRDAERYRWLRDRMAVEDMPEEHPSWSTPSEHESRKFDAAVDSAMNGANA